ncbi:metal-dependent phosphohydrolase, partial [Enterocloster bolteae]|nr:metal-dependent phosphohydrolase [Enterocloster bolteae]
DIGRFEQLKRYDSFDDSIVPHADLSLSILFDENLIRSFIPERDYDSVIYTAIKNHGVYLMDDSLTGRDRLH